MMSLRHELLTNHESDEKEVKVEKEEKEEKEEKKVKEENVEKEVKEEKEEDKTIVDKGYMESIRTTIIDECRKLLKELPHHTTGIFDADFAGRLAELEMVSGGYFSISDKLRIFIHYLESNESSDIDSQSIFFHEFIQDITKEFFSTSDIVGKLLDALQDGILKIHILESKLTNFPTQSYVRAHTVLQWRVECIEKRLISIVRNSLDILIHTLIHNLEKVIKLPNRSVGMF